MSSFNTPDITDSTKKENIILAHIPTKYFKDLLPLFAPTSTSNLSLDDLETSLTTLFNPQKTLLKSLEEFKDRMKQKSESYSQYYKDLNRLTE